MPLSVLTSRHTNLRKSFCLMIIGTAIGRAAGPQTGERWTEIDFER
jgi:hypothetical protein